MSQEESAEGGGWGGWGTSWLTSAVSTVNSYVQPALDTVADTSSLLVSELSTLVVAEEEAPGSERATPSSDTSEVGENDFTTEQQQSTTGVSEGDELISQKVYREVESLYSTGVNVLSGVFQAVSETTGLPTLNEAKNMASSGVEMGLSTASSTLGSLETLGENFASQSISAFELVGKKAFQLLVETPEDDKLDSDGGTLLPANKEDKKKQNFADLFKCNGGADFVTKLETLSSTSLLKFQTLQRTLSSAQLLSLNELFVKIQEEFDAELSAEEEELLLKSTFDAFLVHRFGSNIWKTGGGVFAPNSRVLELLPLFEKTVAEGHSFVHAQQAEFAAELQNLKDKREEMVDKDFEKALVQLLFLHFDKISKVLISAMAELVSIGVELLLELGSSLLSSAPSPAFSSSSSSSLTEQPAEHQQLEETEIEKQVLEKATLVRSLNSYLSLQTSTLSSSYLALLTDFSSSLLLHCEAEDHKTREEVNSKLHSLTAQLSLEVSAASGQLQDCRDLLVNVSKLILIHFFTSSPST